VGKGLPDSGEMNEIRGKNGIKKPAGRSPTGL